MIHQRRGALPRWGLALPFFGSQNLTSLLHLLPAPHSFLALDPGKEERERENDAEEQKSGEERRSQVTTYRNPLPLTYHSTTTSGIISGSSSNTYYPIATENAYLFSSGGGGVSRVSSHHTFLQRSSHPRSIHSPAFSPLHSKQAALT